MSFLQGADVKIRIDWEMPVQLNDIVKGMPQNGLACVCVGVSVCASLSICNNCFWLLSTEWIAQMQI